MMRRGRYPHLGSRPWTGPTISHGARCKPLCRLTANTHWMGSHNVSLTHLHYDFPPRRVVQTVSSLRYYCWTLTVVPDSVLPYRASTRFPQSAQ
ncbi:hypothetical protein DAEQUDRAFT_604305 [Daedalea quercina L-15889]|uniref:Uncharacterized protein n=1 Tax=Daedalea quercina L-15889 TaxID=1314783 RepID=A0A165LKV4_9APHY|nr:hypothetical protein DAEQUDRAFT_604305 [Daedalea quercina L-15889]